MRFAVASLVTLALVFLAAGSLQLPAAASSLNNVQVFVTTAASLPYSYTVAVYNGTGNVVATYQASMPAAAFELPSGQYLFTVSATYLQYGICYECPIYASGGAPPSAGGVPTESGPTAFRYTQPASEYGYQTVQISSSTTLNIQTQNVTQFPTSSLTVKVSFVNGTAASGAYVSAAVVGQWYYWWGQSSNTVMWAQTGTDGVATLVVPKAPTIVSAWDWVAVNLPESQTTVVKNVGGQDINVTVYWQPSYVGLAASALVIPPSDSVNLTLRYQQPAYWAMPAGVSYTSTPSQGTGSTTIASKPTAVPNQSGLPSARQSGQSPYFIPSQIPTQSVTPAPSGSSGTLSPQSIGLTAAAGAAAIFGAMAATLVVLKIRKGPREA